MTELEYVEKEIENVKDLIKETENCSEYTSYMKENIIKDHNLTIATLNSIKKKLEAFEIINKYNIEVFSFKKFIVKRNETYEYYKNALVNYEWVDDKETSKNLTEQEFYTLKGVLK